MQSLPFLLFIPTRRYCHPERFFYRFSYCLLKLIVYTLFGNANEN